MNRALITASLLLCLNGPTQAQQALSGFAEFRSFPYLDRAYRAAQREDWQQVEQLMRHLLERVPQQQEAQRLLVQALAQQRRYDEAALLAESLADTADGAQLLLELRLAWIEQGHPGSARVEGWMSASEAAARQRLWQAHSLALAERQSDGAALQWLQGLPGDAPQLQRWRAVWAEKQQDWSALIAQLQPLAERNELHGQDWQRLGLAYASRQDDAALRRLLASAPSRQAANQLREQAGERAIAAGQPQRAMAWLVELYHQQALSPAQQLRLWELARQNQAVDWVQRLADELQRPCLETSEWLSRRDADKALLQLRRCDPQGDPQQWLILAQRLGDSQSLAQHRLAEPWDSQRRAVLVERWVAQGQSEQAIAWLGRQRQTPAVLRQRAELLQRAGRNREAAPVWLSLYRSDGDLQALDQASFIGLQNGQRDEVLALLAGAYATHGARLPTRLLQRLAGLYAEPSTRLAVGPIESLLEDVDPASRAQLLGRLAEAGACEPVYRNAGDAPGETGQLRALGRCAMPGQPGVAVVYYRQALARGDAGSRLPLAYALDAAGDPQAAYEIWRRYPSAQLDPEARLAAARSALSAGQVREAQQRWQSLEQESAEVWRLGAAIALADGQAQTALQYQRRAIDAQPSAEHLYEGSNIALATGDAALSLAWLQQALRQAPDVARYRSDYAQRLAASRDPAQRRESIAWLQRVAQGDPQDYRIAETLAARYDEVGDSAAAREQLRRAIDLQQVPMAVAEDAERDMRQRRYRLRRGHESLSRRDSVSLSSTWSPAGVAAADAQSAGTRAGAQNVQIAMWDHALGEEPSRAGRSLSVYARALLGSQQRSRYGESLGAGLGLRYKPFGALNLNLYGELYGESRLPDEHSGLALGQLFDPGRLGDSLGDHRREGRSDVDLLLRASASLLDQGKWRNDWRTDERDWGERSLYLDAAWWSKSGDKQLLARYQQGHVFKLPTASAQTLMPYALLQAGSQSGELDWREDLRAGVGVRWQLWFDDDRYNAFRGRLSLRVEYQQSLGGTLYDGEGGWLTGLELNF
ncbi:NfrA family protein [Phytopseudomonas dryadis]|uniref:Phage receptor n=1 Tax=Phytopseudomonas dryadis TaxID=2487520 RepID=A0A4Q9QVD3_9GAMM|nr:phage receptor [Pseudomonas dryadis]TBU86558.1 phage receptor [Pseudomonas dryadis]